MGGMGGSAVGGSGQSIVVTIVDACPATNAENYCKTAVAPEQRCMAAGTNMLDIDVSAYQALTGQPSGSVSLAAIAQKRHVGTLR